MNRIAFLIPYYGKFNNYFPLWLKSCEANSDIADFFIITDIPYEANRPDNVRFIPMSWKDLIKRIQSFYDFKIALSTPYGLCDYKCAYGEIFQEFISGYSHWAYGDNDLIWGKWSNLLPKDWNSYDKIGDYGHLTIVRNSDEMNKLYRYSGAYKIAFNEVRNLFFDEQGFNQIVAKKKKKTLSLKIVDCNPRIRKITPITPINNDCSGVFVWENGQLFHVYDHFNDIKREEIMYIHFLKRKMSVSTCPDPFLIHSLNIENISDEGIIQKTISEERKTRFYFEYWKKYLSVRQIYKTIKSRVNPARPLIQAISNQIMQYDYR